MKAADFLYHRPASTADAVTLLSEYGGDARILAGGQSLLPMMNLRLWRPAALIDIADLADLDRIEVDGETTILGARVRHHRIETDPLVAERLPLLPRMIRYVGDRQVRNRGTLGGSLVQADPTGEMPLAALVLDAVAHVRGPSGMRTIPLRDFFVGSYAAAVERDEMLVEVHYPRHPNHFAFFEINRRHNDFAVISVAVVGDRDDDGTWRSLRIGLGGADETPVIATEAAALVEGSGLDDDAIACAAEQASTEISPPSDVRASDEYRRHLCKVYVARGLKELRGKTIERRDRQ